MPVGLNTECLIELSANSFYSCCSLANAAGSDINSPISPSAAVGVVTYLATASKCETDGSCLCNPFLVSVAFL